MIDIRPERSGDEEAIAAVNRSAFGSEKEVTLVSALRKSRYFIPELSLVAADGDRIVGHILLSPITIHTESGPVAVLSLAPMAVVPDRQREGIGSLLVERALAAAANLGHTIVVVIGHPAYYPRFGFGPAGQEGLVAPFEVPDDAFMVLELRAGALNGVAGSVEFSPPFQV
jgi:putative acetyltransferase